MVQRPLVFSLRVQMDLGVGFGVSEWAGCWPGLPLHAHRDLGVGLEKFGNCAGLQVDVGEFLDCLLFALTSPGVQWCGYDSLLHVCRASVARGGGWRERGPRRWAPCGGVSRCVRGFVFLFALYFMHVHMHVHVRSVGVGFSRRWARC